MRHANKALGILVAVLLPLIAYATGYFWLGPVNGEGTETSGNNPPVETRYRRFQNATIAYFYWPMAKAENVWSAKRLRLEHPEDEDGNTSPPLYTTNFGE